MLTYADVCWQRRRLPIFLWKRLGLYMCVGQILCICPHTMCPHTTIYVIFFWKRLGMCPQVKVQKIGFRMRRKKRIWRNTILSALLLQRGTPAQVQQRRAHAVVYLVSIRRHTSAHAVVYLVGIRRRTSAQVQQRRAHALAYLVGIRQHTSAHAVVCLVGIRRHTSAHAQLQQRRASQVEPS